MNVLCDRRLTAIKAVWNALRPLGLGLCEDEQVVHARYESFGDRVRCTQPDPLDVSSLAARAGAYPGQVAAVEALWDGDTDVARALAAIHGAVTASTEVSRTRDTGPVTEAALDYGLSQRALITMSSRADTVAELIPAASPRSSTAASRPPTSPSCARWSARPSVTSAPPRPRRPPIRRWIRPLPRCGASSTTWPPARTRSGS
jgi:hypothetical protein